MMTSTTSNKTLAIAASVACLLSIPSLSLAENAKVLDGPDIIEDTELPDINIERRALFKPEGWSNFYHNLDTTKADIYEASGFKSTLYHSTLYQVASNSVTDKDRTGLTSIAGFYSDWELVEKGNPARGQLSIGVEGRWGYGSQQTALELGFQGIGSATGTADVYGESDPIGVLRELYWQGGSVERGWSYRIGKFTPDRLFATSAHINPISSFLPVGSEGAPSIAFPDSGLSIAGYLYPSDRVQARFVISDAHGDRANFGDIGKGDFFKAVELQGKLFPITENAGFSSVTLWHTDGTGPANDAEENGNRNDGWGYFVKFEQELSQSGKDIAIVRYGHSFDESSIYKSQGSIRYVRLSPFDFNGDMFGIAASFVDPLSNPHDRDEWGVDTFYRFNVLKNVEVTLGYQVIFNPAYNPSKDNVHVGSFRITQFF